MQNIALQRQFTTLLGKPSGPLIINSKLCKVWSHGPCLLFLPRGVPYRRCFEVLSILFDSAIIPAFLFITLDYPVPYGGIEGATPGL